MQLAQHDLSNFQRCEKRFEYDVVRGLKPLKMNEKVDMGSLFHIALREGYRAIQAGNPFIEPALKAVDETTEDRDGRKLDLTVDQRNLVFDMVNYYWNNQGAQDIRDGLKIIRVEEPLKLEIGGYIIESTFDLLCEWQGRECIWDHKTVGNVKESHAFLKINFQAHEYPLAAARHYGRPMDFVYNLVRRDVPPGFGHKSLFTASGAKSRASTSREDYLRRELLTFTDKKIDGIEKEVKLLLKRIETAKAEDYYKRTPIKTGGEACTSGCPYFELCAAEFVGQQIGPAFMEMFRREATPTT